MLLSSKILIISSFNKERMPQLAAARLGMALMIISNIAKPSLQHFLLTIFIWLEFLGKLQKYLIFDERSVISVWKHC